MRTYRSGAAKAGEKVELVEILECFVIDHDLNGAEERGKDEGFQS